MKKYLLIVLVMGVMLAGTLFAGNEYAFDVDGPVMFRVLDHADLDVTGDFTIEAWVQFDNFNGRLCDREGVLKIYATASSIRFDLDAGGGAISTGDVSSDAGDNSWHHIAVSRDHSATTTRIFYDGVEKASFDMPLIASDKSFSIGGQDAWYGNWDARMDEFRFSNSCRYTSNFTPPTNAFTDDGNTILLFHFDDNTEGPPENDGSTTYTYGNGRSTGTYVMDASDYVDYGDLSLPVTLSSFSARPSSRGIQLSWITASEIENLGFNLYRSTAGDDFELISGFLKNSELRGQGNSTAETAYSFQNSQVDPGQTYTYLLADVDYKNVETRHVKLTRTVTVAENESTLPGKFTLSAAYPNPFNPSFTLPLTLDQAGEVRIDMYNQRGQLVETITDQHYAAGYHGIHVNGSQLATGVYLISCSIGNERVTQKVVLMK
jgi:hypothetical protein